MTKMKSIAAVTAFFGVLALCAAMNFPQGHYDGEMTRGLRALDFFVHGIATDNFGNTGGAIFYGVIGLALTGLIAIASPPDSGHAEAGPRTASREPRGQGPETAVNEPATAGFGRRRTFAASGMAEEKPTAYTSPARSEYKDPWTADEIERILEADDLIPPIAADPASGPVPAWGLMLASPFERSGTCSSWFGGLPFAGQGFEWPVDPQDGEKMHFYAQIDLADLQPEPETGLFPPGLPREGALLIFMRLGGAVRIVSAEDLQSGGPIPAPADLPDLNTMGYWEDGKLFPAWPIQPRAFLDHPIDEDVFWEEMDGEARPAAFPAPHEEPRDWITNWGMAALDAGIALEELERDFGRAREYKMGTAHQHTRDYYDLLLSDGPELMEMLREWKQRAESEDPLGTVDRSALDSIFAQRRQFCDKVGANFTATIVLRGAPYKMWEKIWRESSGANAYVGLQSVPPYQQDFVEKRIADWRRHRLFGIEPPLSNNSEDLRGKACLVSIGADPLLGTQTEHEYGLSIWGPVEDLQNGRFDRLEVVRHCAV